MYFHLFFTSTLSKVQSKSRENFLEILQAGAQKYVLNEVAEV